MSELRKGDKVLWQYTHQNGRSRFERVKRGIFWGVARHTAIHWRKYNAVQMAWVHFEGNKGWSKVPLSELLQATPKPVIKERGEL